MNAAGLSEYDVQYQHEDVPSSGGGEMYLFTDDDDASTVLKAKGIAGTVGLRFVFDGTNWDYVKYDVENNGTLSKINKGYKIVLDFSDVTNDTFDIFDGDDMYIRMDIDVRLPWINI